MKRLVCILSGCLLMLWWSGLNATTSLSFNGGGYSISMEIGHDDEPVVSSLKVHTPRTPEGALLRGNFTTEAFDAKGQVLRIRFIQQDPREEPESFTLSVEGDVATLHIGDRIIVSTTNARVSFTLAEPFHD
jgi:hypothetical protein